MTKNTGNPEIKKEIFYDCPIVVNMFGSPVSVIQVLVHVLYK